MTKQDRIRVKLIKAAVSPNRIHELCFAVLGEGEWSASVAILGSTDRRFRFTQGKLLDEATIGDTRALA